VARRAILVTEHKIMLGVKAATEPKTILIMR
jgi:hypothetical protein